MFLNVGRLAFILRNIIKKWLTQQFTMSWSYKVCLKTYVRNILLFIHR